MILDQDIDQVKQHWAIKAIPDSEMKRADAVRQARLLEGVIGRQLEIDFQERDPDERLLERVALAYELAANEGITALLRPSESNLAVQKRTTAGAFLGYDYLRVLRLPEDYKAKILHVFRLIGLAYSGERGTDVRRFLKESFVKLQVSVTEDLPWDERVLVRLYECWTIMVKKDSWEDIDRIRELIVLLREEQKEFEERYLAESSESVAKFAAFRLVALYHWARATEILATYMLQGEPVGVLEEVNKHFDAALSATVESRDIPLESVIRWVHVASIQMILGSLWWTFQTINSRVTKFVRHVTRVQGMFELLPPQRAALQEQGLLDTASRAVAVNLPTSGGKTALAQFRILVALNQFDAEQGWVAYIAPTRALVSQVTRRLRRDFSPIGVEVMQMTGAVDIDGFEEALLAESSRRAFDVLVMTPEKLDLVIRNKKISRPLVLVVVDEAHSIEDEERGLRLELLLSTIKSECNKANFLLLMPYVPNSSELVEWLAPSRGRSISLGTTPWQPNERIIGTYDIDSHDNTWSMKYETLVTSQKTLNLAGVHKAGENGPLSLSFKEAKTLTNQTAAMSKIFSARGTSIAIARTIDHAWKMARNIEKSITDIKPISENIALVQRFIETELSPKFELVQLLSKRIGVHHAGLPDEVRSLMEWLAEIGELDVLCATTTITQGINFPVSSIFLSSRFKAGKPIKGKPKEMSPRDFWNLAGRAGRIDQSSLGVVGIASGKERVETVKFVSQAVESLISTFVRMLDELEEAGRLNSLRSVIYQDQWGAFRSYIAHLWNEKGNLEELIGETEQLLRNTLGYKTLRDKVHDPKSQKKAQALLDVTKYYATELAKKPNYSALADATGFAPEGVGRAIAQLSRLDKKLTTDDWEPESLFGSNTPVLQNLVGVMLSVKELSQPLEEIGGKGLDRKRLANLTQEWVKGSNIEDIARAYFSESETLSDEELTNAMSRACRAIYRNLANYGTWGLASLSKLPNSGLDFENMTDEQKRKYNNLPAMIYYGVRSEAGILMRMNSVPRSIADKMGEQFARHSGGDLISTSPKDARDFVRSLSASRWDELKPAQATMSGEDYRHVWEKLSGENL